MRRKGKRHSPRRVEPDTRYKDVLVAKFINHVMKGGNKSTAQRIVYDAFDIIKTKTKDDPLEVFHRAIRSASPNVEIISRRIGGAVYRIPKEVRGSRKTSLAIRWIIDICRKQKGKAMKESLAAELMAASKNEGGALQKKREIQKIAEANRAFAHLAR